MTSMSRMRNLAASAAAAVLLAGPALAAQKAAPAAAAKDGLLGYVVVPHLQQTMGRVESIGEMFKPGSLPPGTLAQGLAAMLGDPGLASLAAKPIVLMVMEAETPMAAPRMALFVPVTKPSPGYEAALAGMGWKTRSSAGLLIGASTPEALTSARALETEYRRLQAAAIPYDGRVVLNTAKLMDAYGPMLQMGLAAMVAGMESKTAEGGKDAPPAGLTKLLQLEAKGILAVLAQSRELRWDFLVQRDAVGIDMGLVAKPGTALAEVSSMAPPSSSRATALLSESGTMAGVYQVDFAKVSSFVGALLREVGDEPDTAGLVKDLLSMVQDMGTLYTGDFAMRIDARASGFLMEVVAGVSDEARAMALMEKGQSWLAPGGALQSLYKQAGISFDSKLLKGVRKHAGVPVHRLKFSMDMKGATEEMKMMQQMFLRDTDFAFTRGYYLGAQDPATLDRLIDRALANAPPARAALHSVRAFGEGRHGYFDYDVFGLLKAMGSMPMMTKAKDNPFAKLPAMAAEPVLYAISLTGGEVLMQSKWPLRPFVALAEAAQKPAASTPPKN